MLLETLSTDLTTIRNVNSTDAMFPLRPLTANVPTSNDGVKKLRSGGEYVQNAIIVFPYATSGNNGTFSVRVIGWHVFRLSEPSNRIWFPIPLVELACQCGNIPGVGGVITSSMLFADTITVTTGNSGVDVDVISPANDTPAHAVVDLKGVDLVEVLFQITSGPTDMNCLYALV